MNRLRHDLHHVARSPSGAYDQTDRRGSAVVLPVGDIDGWSQLERKPRIVHVADDANDGERMCRIRRTGDTLTDRIFAGPELLREALAHNRDLQPTRVV